MNDFNVFREPSWDGKSIKIQSKKTSEKRCKKAGHQDGQQDGKVDFWIPGRGRTLSVPPPQSPPPGGRVRTNFRDLDPVWERERERVKRDALTRLKTLEGSADFDVSGRRSPMVSLIALLCPFT